MVRGTRAPTILVIHVAISSLRAKAAIVASKLYLLLGLSRIYTLIRDCALDDSCVMCAPCFRATNHDNHTVTFYIAQQSGGCCDCGDVEAWRYPIGCPLHCSINDSTYESKTGDIDLRTARENPSRRGIPPELWDSMSRTIAYALEYVLHTLEFSPDDCTVPVSEKELKDQPTADPNVRDIFATIVWNDEKHSFDEVTRHLCDTVGRSNENATAIVDAIDEQGREVVDIRAYESQVLDVAHAIARIDIGVTVKRAYDTFREQVSDTIIEWLLDLTRCRVGTDGPLLREIIAAELFAVRKRDLVAMAMSVVSPGDNGPLSEFENPSRLDWLFVFHSRLWKRPRLYLKELYVSVLTLSNAHRLAVCTSYIYGLSTEAY